MVFNNPKGTYNPVTRVYTSPSGDKQSMKNAPVGATIEIINPNKNSGGGGGYKISPNLPQSSPTNLTPPASSGQTMESVKQQTDLNNKLELQRKLDEALKSGDILGNSGKLMSDQEYAKMTFLNQIEANKNQMSIKPQSQYGEFVNAQTKQGYQILEEARKQVPIQEVIKKKSYEVDKNWIENRKREKAYFGMEGGGGTASTLNVGTPVNLRNPIESYKQNIRTSSTEQAFNLALMGKGFNLYKLGKPIIENIYPISKKIITSTSGKLFIAGAVASDYLVPKIDEISKSIYYPSSIKGRFGKAVVEGAVISSSPFLAGAYGKQLAVSVLKSPWDTVNSMVVNYPETLGFIAGGGIKIEAKLPKMELGKMDVNPQTLSFGKGIKANIKNIESGKFKISYDIPFKQQYNTIKTVTWDKYVTKEYKPIETNALGEKTIIGAKGTNENFDIGLIQPRGTKLEVNPNLIGNVVKPKTPSNPWDIAKSEFEKNILEVTKKQNDIIGGSFAGNVLFENARLHNDIDIISKYPKETAKLLETERKVFESKINDITLIQERSTGIKVTPTITNGIEVIKISDAWGNQADIVNLKGYKSDKKMFGFGKVPTTKVMDWNVINPEILLKHKLEILKDLGLEGEKSNKAIKDIQTYTKNELNPNPNKATMTGAYGYTKSGLNQYVGKSGNIAHSSTGLFSVFNKEFFKELNSPEKTGKIWNIFQDKIKLQQAKESGGFHVLFGTPWDLVSRKTQTRVSRTGMNANWEDLARGEYTTTKPTGKPQVIVFENQKVGLNTNKIQTGVDWNIIHKSSELEVGLPVEMSKGIPNVIRQKSKAGVTLINGQRVELKIGESVKADTILDKNIVDQLKKRDKLNEEQIRKLNEEIYKQTNIDNSRINKPYFDLQRIWNKSIKQVNDSMSKNIKSSSEKPSNKSVYSQSIPSMPSIPRISIPSMPSMPSNPSKSNPSKPSNPSRSNPSNPSKSNPSKTSNPSRPSIPSNPWKPEKTINPWKPMETPKEKKSKSLGKGFNVLIKQLKSNKFIKINNYPLTKNRANDIGSYQALNTLIRTYEIKPAGKEAQEDYQFMYVPIGYYETNKNAIREFKIRNGRNIQTPERFIQKRSSLLQTSGELKEIKEFRKLANTIWR